MNITKDDVKAILLEAYHNGYIEPSDFSDWGFDYTDNNRQWLISDGLTEMFKEPMPAFKYTNIINDAGKELRKELAQ